MFDLLILTGSLRKASSSAALARAVPGLVRDDVRVRSFDIGRLPHYDADLENDAAVDELKRAVADADGVLFVTPEYNYSIPGVLKNAIDWASRPAYNSVFKDKPVFVVSVSGGALGGVRAQAHLKYVMNGLLARVFPWQEIIVPHANKKVEDGRFTDPSVLAFLGDALTAFRAFAGHAGAEGGPEERDAAPRRASRG
jgi:chromate reductase